MLLGSGAGAGPRDYRFELVSAQPEGAGKTALTIRLLHLPDNKPVAGAVLFESKTDMAPSGMADMAGKVSPLPGDPPGLYRFPVKPGTPAQIRPPPPAHVPAPTRP